MEELAVSSRRSFNDEKFKSIIKFSDSKALLKNKISGKNYCKLCLEDPGLKDTCKVIEGHVEHVRHLFTGFMATTWSINHSNKSG